MTEQTAVTTDDQTTVDPATVADDPKTGAASSNTDDKINLADGGDDPKPEPKGDEAEDTRTDEEKAADEAKAALFGAPAEGEDYAIEGLPEGMTIDKEALDAVAPAFRELGLSNVGASKVAQVYAEKVLPQVEAKYKTALEQQIVDQRTNWQAETLKAIKGEAELVTKTGDKIDFGGATVKEVQQVAAAALDRVAPAEFREFLDETGLGQHPAMVAFAYRVGKLISEDKAFEGGSQAPQPKSTEAKFYG
jgi:hypothetical protein